MSPSLILPLLQGMKPCPAAVRWGLFWEAVRALGLHWSRRRLTVEAAFQRLKHSLQAVAADSRGPLPQDIVAALSTFFGIHDEFAIQLDEAMLELAGVGIDDVQELLNETDE